MTIDPAIDNDDYDWAVYELSEYRCADIYGHYPEMPQTCDTTAGHLYGPGSIR